MSRSPASGRKALEARLRRVGGQAESEIELAEAARLLQQAKAQLNSDSGPAAACLPSTGAPKRL
ncbi:MAG: hypothetical protein ACE5KF_11885 [Kiloniellaceae bacterium]